MSLVSVDKRRLSFHLDPSLSRKRISDTIFVNNITPHPVAFKVKTTNQERYVVQPNIGLIQPRSTLAIVICFAPLSTLPDSDTASTTLATNDRFMLLVSLIAQQHAGDLFAFWNSRRTNPDERHIKLYVDFTKPPTSSAASTVTTATTASSSASVVPSTVTTSASTSTVSAVADTTGLRLPEEARDIQTDLCNLEHRLSELQLTNDQNTQKQQRCLDELRNAENALTKSKMDLQICRSQINILRPTLQTFISDAREKQLRDQQQALLLQNQMQQECNCEESAECTICLEEGDKKGWYALPCGHVFHRLCIKTWLVQKNCCPVCKRDVS